MEKIEKWIFNDILNSIHKLNFSTEAAPFPYLHASTDPYRKLIVYNPNTVTLYEITEEYIHALKNHHRKNSGYDFKNPDESEAHNLALDYLIDRWWYYDGANNWLRFMNATGAPAHLQDLIVAEFNVPTSVLFQEHM